MRTSVVGGAERDAVVVHLGLEREDLESARIGERESAPTRELAETPEPFDRVGARTQHELIRVAEDDLGAE